MTTSINHIPSRRHILAKVAGAITSIFLGALVLTACASPQSRIVETHYGLNPSLDALTIKEGQKIVIDRINAAGIFAGRQIVEQIKTSPEQYVETRSKLWHSSPGELLRDAMIKGWNQSTGYKVISTATTGDADYRLDIDIARIGYGASGKGFVSIRAIMKDKSRNIIVDDYFEASGPSAVSLDDKVKSIETAMAAAVNALGQEISTAGN